MKLKLLKIVPVFIFVALMTACGEESKELEVTTEIFTETTTEISSETVSETITEVMSETSTEILTEVEGETVSIEIDKPTTETVPAKTATQKPIETPTETPVLSPVSKEIPETSIQNETPVSIPAAGSLGVTYKGKKVMLNTDINSAALGNTTDYSEAPSCNYDGLDKVFTYGNVSIYTYPYADCDLINEIEVNDNSVTTDKGIEPIGKSIEDIKSVYGEPTAVEGSTYKYANDSCYTYFYAYNGIVSYWGVVYEG